MKISVSLPGRDVEFLDQYARDIGETRSGAVQRAVRALRYERLTDHYREAFAEGSPWEAPLPDAPGDERAAG